MISILELQNAVKVYESGSGSTVVLDDISLRIGEGEMVAVTGPSGSGKSTLLNVLGCVDTLSAGRYLISGTPVPGDSRSLARLRNEVFGFVFQFFGLVSEYSVAENVMLPLLYRGVSYAQAKRSAVSMLKQVGLAELRDSWPANLSGGQQQRVAIARALVGEPKVILADEPTGSLDSVTGAEVLTLLEAYHQQGHTVVIVTHSLDVSRRCERSVHVRDGKVLEESATV